MGRSSRLYIKQKIYRQWIERGRSRVGLYVVYVALNEKDIDGWGGKTKRGREKEKASEH